MATDNSKSRSYTMHCPNCGVILAGIANADGTGKNTCRRCGVRVVRKEDSRRHIKVDIYSPKNGYLDDLIE